MTFRYWFNEIADIPTQDKDGSWYDAETGFGFAMYNKKAVREVKVLSDSEKRYGSMKVGDLRNLALRLVGSTAYSVNKNEELYDVSALKEVVESGKNIDKMKKSELFELIDMNSKASRIINNQLKGATK